MPKLDGLGVLDKVNQDKTIKKTSSKSSTTKKTPTKKTTKKKSATKKTK